MQTQRTLPQRLRAAAVGISELDAIGVDGGERGGGMRVLGRRDPRFTLRL